MPFLEKFYKIFSDLFKTITIFDGCKPVSARMPSMDDDPRGIIPIEIANARVSSLKFKRFIWILTERMIKKITIIFYIFQNLC